MKVRVLLGTTDGTDCASVVIERATYRETLDVATSQLRTGRKILAVAVLEHATNGPALPEPRTDPAGPGLIGMRLRLRRAASLDEHETSAYAARAGRG